MRRIAALVDLRVLAACSPGPRTVLAYNPTGLGGAALPDTLVVTMPYDDRYDSERVGETRVIRFALVSLGGGGGSFRGNSVTSDLDFLADGGPFGTRSIAAGVGNLVFKGFSRDSQSVIAATGPLMWRCAGPCAPAPDSVVSVATKLRARYVLATRVVHLYALQYSEREFSVASTETKQGNLVYKVTTTVTAQRASDHFGSCVLELSLFEVQGGQIINTTRWSLTGWVVDPSDALPGQAAAGAVGLALDDARRRRIATGAAEGGAELPAAGAPTAPAPTPAPAERGPPPRQPPPRQRPRNAKKGS